jgi:hypothetical protein
MVLHDVSRTMLSHDTWAALSRGDSAEFYPTPVKGQRGRTATERHTELPGVSSGDRSYSPSGMPVLSKMHVYGQNIRVRILGTRAEASTMFWMSAVGVPGGAGAGELCKSVEVHSSDSGDMAQSLTIARLQHWVQKFSHGCVWTLQADFVLIGQYIIAHAPRNTSVLNPRTPVPQLSHESPINHSSALQKPNDSETSTTSRTHVADGEWSCQSFIVSTSMGRRPSSAHLRVGGKVTWF